MTGEIGTEYIREIGGESVTESHGESRRVTKSHEESRRVTKSHEESRKVTKSHDKRVEPKLSFLKVHHGDFVFAMP
jgi:hypothetical protein